MVIKMKLIYRACTIILMLLFIFFASSVSVFLLKKPVLTDVKVASEIIIEEFVFNKVIIDNQISYSCSTKTEINRNKAISVSFLLFEIEKQPIRATIEDINKYYQVIISINEQASVVESIK